MFRRSARPFAVLVAVSAAGLAITSSGGVAQAYTPPTALVGHGPKATPLKNAAMIEKTDGGYRFKAGQQNSHITVTLSNGKLRFADTGTRELRDIPGSCSKQRGVKGIAAVCNVSGSHSPSHPLYIEVWPRLGNDSVNGSTLPASTRLWVLTDAGDDTVYGGAGRDFVNGAKGRDHVQGGGGSDWLRTGDNGDSISGGAGNDKLVGGSGGDTIRTGSGTDTAGCGPGSDLATVSGGDHTNSCERVRRG